ncbi:MAG: cytochrome C oxidase subunit IV family protein [Acidimicrobiia bacterium]
MSTEHHHHDDEHPNPAQYWKIAALLATLTAIEVALFYIDNALDLRVFNAIALLGLSLLKFIIVIGWFMHLRFEKPILSRFFTAGFVLAMGLYLVVLASLGVVAIRS